MSERTTTRRSVLAALAAGSAALAGCSALGGETETELDAAALREAVRGDPRLRSTLPVDIEQDYLDARRTRIEETLADVPELTPTEIPNGAMREELVGAREGARSALDEASEAETAFEALERLREARREAGELAGGWAYIRGELDTDALSERAASVQEDITAFEERWSYRGAGPVRAVLVHAAIEDARRRAAAEARTEFQEDVNAVSVGETAGDLALARAAIEDAGYLYDRFRASLDSPRDLTATFDAALDDLSAELSERREPYIDSREAGNHVDAGDLEDTVAGYALETLLDAIRYHGIERREGWMANALLAGQRSLALVSAFEALGNAVESEGVERFRIGSASDVASLRSAATEALADALEASESEGLARALLDVDAGALARADSEIARNVEIDDDATTTDGAGRTIEADWIRREVSVYVRVAAIARATPPAVERGVTALEN